MFKYFSKALGVAGYVIQYGCITHCTFEYIGDFVVCSGPSMEPTLYSNNILVTERITPRFSRIQRGDIIIAKCPTNPRQHICKRVVGLPGDRILAPLIDTLRPGRSQATGIDALPAKKNPVDQEIDSALREENAKSVIAAASKLRACEVIVPRGHVWLEGDNAENSADSRYYGPVPQGLIKSRAVCRLWPITKIKLLI